MGKILNLGRKILPFFFLHMDLAQRLLMIDWHSKQNVEELHNIES